MMPESVDEILRERHDWSQASTALRERFRETMREFMLPPGNLKLAWLMYLKGYTQAELDKWGPDPRLGPE